MKKKVEKKVAVKKPRITAKVVNKEVVKVEAPNTQTVCEASNVDILNSISHPNKKILAQKILDGVSFDELVKSYGRTRVLEMQKYIQDYSINLAKDCELKAKRGNGVCLACQR